MTVKIHTGIPAVLFCLLLMACGPGMICAAAPGTSEPARAVAANVDPVPAAVAKTNPMPARIPIPYMPRVHMEMLPDNMPIIGPGLSPAGPDMYEAGPDRPILPGIGEYSLPGGAVVIGPDPDAPVVVPEVEAYAEIILLG